MWFKVTIQEKHCEPDVYLVGANSLEQVHAYMDELVLEELKCGVPQELLSGKIKQISDGKVLMHDEPQNFKAQYIVHL